MEVGVKLSAKIYIKVSNIKVIENYYSFNYLIKVNGKEEKGCESGDYDGQTAEHFKKVLENGYALELVLERVLF